MWTRRCETKPCLPHQCGQEAPHHFMCKWSSLITEPSIRFSGEMRGGKKQCDLIFLAGIRGVRIDEEQSCNTTIAPIFYHLFMHKNSYSKSHMNPDVNSSIIAVNHTVQTCKQKQSVCSFPMLRTYNTLKKTKTRTRPRIRGATPHRSVRQKQQQSEWKVACQSCWMVSLFSSFAPVVGLIGPFGDEVGNSFCRQGPRRTAMMF